MEIELMPVQTELFNKVLDACRKLNELRYFFFGGAIRGGKTYSILVVLIFLCRTYPKSKWHVVRKDMTVLLGTTIPSFEKIIASNIKWKWDRRAGNYHVTYLPTGAKIFFKPESLSTDPELNDFLGLETNGLFLEQIEELSAALWKRAIERAGSWYLDKMPPAFIFSSFNPTKRWVKAFVHDKWVEGKLESPFCYIQALPTDNKYVTADQWRAWENIDEVTYRNLIEGSWIFEQAGNTFVYNFKPGKHIIKGLSAIPNLPIILSYDFNVEPITCLVGQCDGMEEVRILDEYRLMNSDVGELSERILSDYPDKMLLVTGDASGQARTAIKRDLNYYKIIKNTLKLGMAQFKLPAANPPVKNTRVLCNSLLGRHKNYHFSDRVPYLILDIEQCLVDEHGAIDKGKDKHQTHLLDCWRYFNWTFLHKYLDLRIYDQEPNLYGQGNTRNVS